MSPTLLVLGFFGLLAAAFFGRALFTGQVLLPLDTLYLYAPWRSLAPDVGIAIPHNHLIADTILQNYSWKALAARAFASGEFPLWNPYLLAGQPFLAAGQNASLYPLGLLFYLLPGGHAYAPFAALHLAIGGGLTYWLTRVLGTSRFGSLLAGTVFGFCGFLVVSVLWPMVVSTAVWLPGLLAIVELVVRRSTGLGYPSGADPRRDPPLVPLVLIGAGLVCLQFLAGHLEMSLYLLLTAGLYAAARLVAVGLAVRSRSVEPTVADSDPGPARPEGGGLSQALAAALLLLGMVGLGSLGAGAQLFPFAEAIAGNVRSGQVTLDDVRGYALPPQQLAAFLAPDVFGNPTHHTVFDLFAAQHRPLDQPVGVGGDGHWGTEWGQKNYVEGTAYVGVLPLLLALAALLLRRDAPTLTFAGLAALALLLAFGTPLYALLFYGLPGVNQLHTPFRWVYPLSLCLAVLAGLGADALWRSAGPRHRRLGQCFGWLTLVLGALGVVLSLAALLGRERLVNLADRALARSAQLSEAFPDAQALYSYEWAVLAGAALLLLASGLVLLGLARRAPGTRALALILLVGDLFAFGMDFNTSANPSLLEVVPPSIQVLQSDPGLHRIVTLGEDDLLPANTGMLFGLQDVRGYDTILLRDYVAFLELIEPQRGLLYSKVDKLFQPASLDSPLLDLLNVRYLLTSQRVDRPGWELVHDGDTRVYRNQEALPRAFLVANPVPAADAAQALGELGRPDFDARRQVVLEGWTPPPGAAAAAPMAAPASPGRAEVTRYGLNQVIVQVETEQPAFLVLSDLYFPGWTVRIGAEEGSLLRANRVFRAVEVPAGRHEVRFEYRPLSFRLGAVLSGLAAGLAALALGTWAYARFGVVRLGEANPVQRVARNTLFPLVTGLLNRGLDFAFALVYLRLLGPAGTGAYTFAVVIVGYFDILVNFGLGTLLTREVARDPSASSRYFGNTLALRVALALLALGAALLLAGPLAGPLEIGPEVGLALVLLTLGMLPGALASTASALFMARERMEVPAAVTVLTNLARVGLGLGALLAGWGIVGLAAVSLVVNLLNAAVLAGLLVAMLGWPRLSLEPAFSRTLLATSWPLMLNNLLNSVFYRVDAVLLKPLAGEAALGHYSTAYKFIDGLQIIPSTFVFALFPLLSRQAGRDPARLAESFGLGLRVLLTLAVPISVGTTLLAEPIIGLFAGPAYLPDAALALQVLIWFLPLSFVNGLTQYVLIALNCQRWITISFFLAASANLVLNLWAIPRFGLMGAAWVTVASEWLLFGPFWYALRQSMPPVPLLSLVWRPVVAAALMGGVVALVREVNPWLSIPIGALVYAGAVLAIGTFDREELRALRPQKA